MLQSIAQACALISALGLCTFVSTAAGSTDLARHVNPFNGTAEGAPDFGTGGGAGNTFPGPTLPFGMVQWGPDTSPGALNRGGGYAYADRKIRGFSLRRLSGAGCVNAGDVPVLPTTAPITSTPVPHGSVDYHPALQPSFTHGREAAQVGGYDVALDPGTPKEIRAQLAATLRTGLGRFTFPAGARQTVLLNPAGSRTANDDAEVSVDPRRREVSGSAASGGFCSTPNRYRLYFVARFDRPFASYGTWRRDQAALGSTRSRDTVRQLAGIQIAERARAGAYVGFAPTGGRRVEVRVGVSFVSVDGARRNLDGESRGRSLSALRREARRRWNGLLRRIEVRGGARADLRTFYSMLYRVLTTPTTFSDRDGRYMGMDQRVHRARGYTQYADFSGWDVYRSQMPLLGLIAPRMASDFVRSLLANQRESGWLPKWSVANGQTMVMTGDPASQSIGAVRAMGARRFDTRRALAAMVKGATKTGVSANAGYVERPALDEYLRLGYVPHERNSNFTSYIVNQYTRANGLSTLSPETDVAWGSAGTTLEYASADFAVARVAAQVGAARTCRTFVRRAANWRKVFDTSIGYVRPRLASGSFVTPYDPNRNDAASSLGFAEGSGSQYTWMVPHDPAGLFRALGGRRAARERLDVFFSQLNAGMSSAYAFLGNEPNSNAPWLFDWIGRPWRTQQVVRQAILGLFDASPGGFPGNDDLGQMSAWYVLGAIGLYPAIPGSDVLAVGSPLFQRTTLRLPRGDVVLVAKRARRGAPYVHGLTVNGRRWTKPWTRVRDIARGATLRFALRARPDKRWGAAVAEAPPSYGPGSRAACRS